MSQPYSRNERVARGTRLLEHVVPAAVVLYMLAVAAFAGGFVGANCAGATCNHPSATAGAPGAVVAQPTHARVPGHWAGLIRVHGHSS